MFSTRLEALRDTAAQGVMEKILSDKERAPRELEPLLSYIEAHLFDPEFSVQAMKDACRVRDNSVVTRFRSCLETRPSAYVKRKRLEVAAELLRTSSEEIWKISELVGFASPQVFTRNFKDAWGASPGEFRQEQGSAVKTVADQSLPENKRLAHDLQKAVDGTLDPAQAEALIQHLETVYRSNDSVALPACTGLFNIGEALRRLPRETDSSPDQQALRENVQVLVELLLRLGRHSRARNRHLSLRLAKLALGFAQESAAELGEELSGLCALSWAWIGTAHRRLFDYELAEQAFEQAEAVWRESSEPIDSAIGSEILHLKSILRTETQRYEEALALIDRAIAMVSEGDCDPRVSSMYLMQRAKNLGELGRSGASLQGLEQALTLAAGDGRLQFCALQCLVTYYATAGKYSEAEALLPEVQRLALLHAEPLERFRTIWAMGLVYEGLGRDALAESQFLAARNGFRKLQAWGFLAGVDLKLAQLRQVRKPSGAVAAAAEAKALFDELGLRRGAETAGALLKEVIR
ncbi:MAG: helix-turn-helix domain-containing protein [Acidobacteriota bacterium]